MSENFSDIFVFKIAVVGDGAVGKTSLIEKYTKGVFNTQYIMTLGAQFTKHTATINNVPIELVFWDIAGQESFASLRPGFYKGCRAVIIVFSHEQNEQGNESFKNVSKWLVEIKKHCGLLPVILFGNKIDLLSDINNLVANKTYPKSNDNVNKLMKGYNFLGYFLTSAKTGQGVDQAFYILAEKLHQLSKLEPRK
ncbi:MAG TPA: Rab family GTPase [Candidatus Lokiarchaeia archaeon]